MPHSVQLLLALASAGFGYQAPDPDTGMSISDLAISSERAGACSASAPHIPAPHAQVAVKFRVKNKDLSTYAIKVYLDVAGQLQSLFPLGSAPIVILGYAPASEDDWSLTYPTDAEAKGVYGIRGYVENGQHGVFTSQWTFRVELSVIATGEVVQRLTAPWSKTYGTCE